METALEGVMSRLAPAGGWRISGFEAAGIDADVIVRLRSAHGEDNVAVRMHAAPPHRITGFARAGQGGGAGAPPAPAAAAVLTPEAQRAVVDSIGRLLERMHVSPDTGRMIAERLRERQRAGAYAGMIAPQAFAAALTEDLQSIDGDRHLRVMVGQPGMRRPGAEGAAAPANHGFERVERLPGNVGYIRISGPLTATQDAVDAGTAALRQVGDADAVVLDLRGVPGGSPVMVDHLVSHFVAAGTPLVRVENRSEGTTEVRRALDAVPGPRRLDVPLYVLVDQGSFSAAEALPFILQSLGRATIVGERTRGGGRNNRFVPVGYGLTASITFTRVTDPRTGRGWEGIGIQPDVVSPAAEALAVAHRYALQRLGRSGS